MSTGIEVGLISDTHGLLRPEALEALRGVSLILHAGDVGGAEILDRLATIAPVHAVRGNTDTGAFGRSLPEEDLIEVGGIRIHLAHGHLPLRIDPKTAGARIEVSGHTHRPVIERDGGRLRINPGSAGPRRFSLPISLARLTINNGEPEARLVEIL